METAKTITLEQTIVVKTKNKIPKKRVVTGTQKWTINDDDITNKQQLLYLQEICEKKIIHKDQCSLILQNITKKINGYKHQDELKKKYNEPVFIDHKYVLQLLLDSELKCHYCKKEIKLLYEMVREQSQWSLDRIDNDYGHNFDNLFVTCLSCNLRRKTMYYERYEFTKQLTISKIN